jgi:serine/threonine protein kinase
MEVRWAMYQLLEALAFAHSRGVMHRDVKPSNVLVSGGRGCPSLRLTVVDWGLAEFLKDGGGSDDGYDDTATNTNAGGHELPRYSCRVASRYYKAPELLLGNEQYDERLDSWSAGCVLAGLIFQREPFFRGSDNFDQVTKIAEVLGSERLLAYADSFQRRDRNHRKHRKHPNHRGVGKGRGQGLGEGAGQGLSDELREAVGAHPPTTWAQLSKQTKKRTRKQQRQELMMQQEQEQEQEQQERRGQKKGGRSPAKAKVEVEAVRQGRKDERRPPLWTRPVRRRRDLCSRDALDLLEQLLCVDHRQRTTAAAALQHPYFAPVRKQLWGVTRVR